MNSRQKSKANSRQDKSIANGRQGERTTTETRRSARRIARRNTLQRKTSASQSRSIQEPMQMFQQVQYELELGEVITTIPKIDLNMETVKYKDQSFTVQKDTEVIGQTNDEVR